jgi:coproporphyrinogen III oxidase
MPQFVRAVAGGILPSWESIVERHRREAFTPAQRDWQLLRRGRYLEFNLLYDRGVRFGLDGGRVESIMVSAPPLVAWRYNVQPVPGSEEAALVEALRAPRDWA